MSDREKWVAALVKIASPVLEAGAQGRLHGSLPTAFHPKREVYAHLEAFGRTLCGIAPWLAAEGTAGEEARAQAHLLSLARQAMDHLTDPASDDFLNFCHDGRQPLVDAAFLAHAIVRAPQQLYADLPSRVRDQVAAALVSTRTLPPFRSNWLFFSAMVETALCVMGRPYEREPIDTAVNAFSEQYYVGDGTYGDGARFHWDYYNGFVIQPMLVDVLRVMAARDEAYASLLETAVRRAARYAAVQEQLIGPDGTYAVFGRSSTYRFGAFQLLSQAALQEFLPPALSPGRVRCALTAVIEKCLSHPDTFDGEGWLRPGVYGFQPSMAEEYICVGSLYLCCAGFVALGLPPQHGFWTAEAEDWTSKRIWSGKDTPRDHSED